MRVTENMLEEGLREFAHWQGVAEYMLYANWTLEDYSVGGPDYHPRFAPNAEYLRSYVEKRCREYMMNDNDWTSAWSGLGFLVFVVVNNEGDKHLAIEWKGNPIERGKELGIIY